MMFEDKERFLYVGPNTNKPPYYGEVFTGQYVGNRLAEGMPLKYFIELEEKDLNKMSELYDLFYIEFDKLQSKRVNGLTPKDTAKISEKVGLKAFVDSLAVGG